MDLFKDFLKEGVNLEAFGKVLTDNFLSLKNITRDAVAKIMEDVAEFKSYRDSFTKKAIDTFKEKTLPGLIEEEIKKKNPPKPDEDPAIAQMKKDMADLKAEREAIKKEAQKQKSIAKLSSLLSEKKISNGKLNSLLENLASDDDEQTLGRGNSLIEGIQELLKAEREKVLIETGYKPAEGGDPAVNKDAAKKFDDAEKRKDFSAMLALAAKKKG